MDEGDQRSDRGAVAAEYAILASLIAIAAIVAVTAFGASVNGLFQLAVDNWP
ncbi:Flp/Fap pilin component [Raineyella antarctica]|uniref:Flp/Fap pilin component n=1 Tax=Raineyella antarctica TaxID=1577474 RepID=A0A1G6GFR1_9ACTN|nr:Flp family type IVb pilin [Raineyella antarctica]SDB80663.1 Flp/Fap pilin component [Raineyella antarctica]